MAEEWKKRWEKERDKNSKLKARIDKLEAEPRKWRGGQTVSAEEQANFEADDVMAASTMSTLPGMQAQLLDKPALALTTSHISQEDRNKLGEERERLYTMLDAKDD